MLVAAACIEFEGRVLVARRAAGDLAGKWEFPGGKVEAGESPESGLIREIREELGVEIVVGEPLSRELHRSGAHTVDLLVFRARLVGGDRGRVGAGGLPAHSEVRWVLPEELVRMDLPPADLGAAALVAARAAPPEGQG